MFVSLTSSAERCSGSRLEKLKFLPAQPLFLPGEADFADAPRPHWINRTHMLRVSQGAEICCLCCLIAGDRGVAKAGGAESQNARAVVIVDWPITC